jgi:CRP/FNR family transcriptional regulator
MPSYMDAHFEQELGTCERSPRRFRTPDHDFRPDCKACKAGRMSLCSKIDDKGLARLQEISHSRLFLRDTILSVQDQVMDELMILLDGMVKLYQDLEDGRRQVIGFLGPGDLLGSIKRTAGTHCTAEAITDVTACTFERAAFLDLVQAFPDLAFQLLITATDEIEAKHFLLTLQSRWQGSGGPRSEVPIPMSRADIADFLGLTVETVSRTLSRFKSQGLIDLPEPHLAVLRNLPALHELMGFAELPERGAAFGL